MQMHELTFSDEIERAGEHLLGLGRKAGDQIGAEHDIGAQPAHLATERNRIGAQVTALHAFEDEIVARLQRQMQMRHQPRLVAERVKQVAIGFDGIDRGKTQPLQLRHLGQNALHQGAETDPSAAR